MSLILFGAGAAYAFLVKDYLRTPFDGTFDKVGKARGVPPNLLRALARHESNMNPKAVSSVNVNGTRDYGLMQINERTARAMGVDPLKLVNNVELSIDTAARVLLDMQRSLGERFSNFTWPMAYNVGPDLLPRSVGETYASKVVWHWTLYDMGRILA